MLFIRSVTQADSKAALRKETQPMSHSLTSTAVGPTKARTHSSLHILLVLFIRSVIQADSKAALRKETQPMSHSLISTAVGPTKARTHSSLHNL